MGTRGLEIVCFHSRYYVRYHQYDSDYAFLGANIVARIPEEPGAYEKWLETMRAEYAAREQALEDGVYTIRAKAETTESTVSASPVQRPQYALYHEYVAVPTMLPCLDGYDAENVYIINLDAAVLTMNYSLHWRLDAIPRADDIWLRAISSSVYRGVHTVDLDMVSDACLASLAVPLPASNMTVEAAVGTLNIKHARTRLDTHDKVWRTLVAANAWAAYGRQIARFGRQWQPQDLPFRELVFALVVLASGRQAAFRSFPKGTLDDPACNPHHCQHFFCPGRHLGKVPGWLGQQWLVGGDKSQHPLLEFGSPAHWNGQPPGVAPLETTYWLTDDVLVSLTLVVDGAAVTTAMEWGLAECQARKQARADRANRGDVRFYMVVLSLFEVVFAEVSQPAATAGGLGTKAAEPIILASSELFLSPLREDFCLSTHPRERPVRRRGQEHKGFLPHTWLGDDDYRRSRREMREDFPGIAAMVNFFTTVDSRRAAAAGARTHRPLPPELYTMILDRTDYATWQTCLLVSPMFRALARARYRLDDCHALVSGPTTVRNVHRGEPLMAFGLHDLATGKTETVMRMRNDGLLDAGTYNWLPLLGGGHRQALMLDVTILFESLAQAEADKKKWDDEQAAYRKKEEEKQAAIKAAVESGAVSTTMTGQV
ncbi:hypothetical protein SCUCBS95973_007009 [Sporothrix curviconia]|uniref:F-box domain-containing protein n=1 Tax=Sporothrix curviconia TaxID=1260050 RepID=A0ABP0CB15_9PEZI